MFIKHIAKVLDTHLLSIVAPQALREEKTKKSLRFLIKKEKPVPRPVTPRVEEPPEVSSCLWLQLTLSLFILHVFEMLFFN